MGRKLTTGDRAAEDLERLDLEALDERLETRSADAIVAWALERLGGLRMGLTSAFGPEGCVLVDLVRRHRPDIPVFTIDTGLLFAESVAVREHYRAMGANVVVVEPLVTLGRRRDLDGGRLYERDPDRCCTIRKVEPMLRVLDRLDVWFTAIRRDQSDTRSATPVLGHARRRDGSRVLKIAPLVRWTRRDTWTYLLDHALPYNPLLDRGYTSIGCRPCTRVASVDEPERAGRWSGRGKIECGIHNL